MSTDTQEVATQHVQAQVTATAPTAAQAAATIEQIASRAEALIPPVVLWGWLSAIGAAFLLFVGYIVVSDVSFHQPEAHAVLTALGDKVAWIIAVVAALFIPAGTLARAATKV